MEKLLMQSLRAPVEALVRLNGVYRHAHTIGINDSAVCILKHVQDVYRTVYARNFTNGCLLCA